MPEIAKQVSLMDALATMGCSGDSEKRLHFKLQDFVDMGHDTFSFGFCTNSVEFCVDTVKSYLYERVATYGSPIFSDSDRTKLIANLFCRLELEDK